MICQSIAECKNKIKLNVRGFSSAEIGQKTVNAQTVKWNDVDNFKTTLSNFTEEMYT